MPKRQQIPIGRPPIYIYPDGGEVILQKLKEFKESTAKRKILVAHRRGRKTSSCLEEVFKYAIANPGIVTKSLAPLRKQAKETIWDDPDMLFKILPRQAIKHIDNSALKIEFKNGSLYYLDGADDPNFQRGGNVKVLHMPEAGDHRESTWSSVYEPILTLNGGIALFDGNPRGMNWFHKLFMAAATRPGWEAWLISALETPIFTKAQLKDIEANVPENVFKAEYLCEWIGSTGTVFRTIRVIATQEYQEAQPNRKYRMGVDLAMQKDFSVMSVVDRHTWNQVKVERFNQLDWTIQKDRMKQTMMDYSSKENENELEVYIEDNGVGSPIYMDLWKWSAEVADTHNITILPYHTTNSSKGLLVSNFSMLSDMNEIHVQKDKILVEEFEQFTFIKNSLHYVYTAPPGLHDDIVMATMFSYWALGAKLPVPNEEKHHSTFADRVAAARRAQNGLGQKDEILDSYILG